MRLSIGKNHQGEGRTVQSIFRLIGNDEDALTYALGFLLARDPDSCVKVIRLCGIRVPRRLRDACTVHLQEVTDRRFGRRDIVIEAADMRVVLEAKVGRSEPTVEQLLRYAVEDSLWEKFSTKAVVALTQVELQSSTLYKARSKLSDKGIKCLSVQWHQIIELALGHVPLDDSEVSRYLFDEFVRYARKDYNMGYHDAEVLILDVNPKNAKIFKEHWLYVGSPKDKRAPLYFAPYFTKRNPVPGITHISRVADTKLVKLSEGPEVIDVGTVEQRERWRTGWSTWRWTPGEGEKDIKLQLFLLEEPVEFRKKPLTKAAFNATGPCKQIPSQIPRAFSLNFDELLRAGEARI